MYSTKMQDGFFRRKEIKNQLLFPVCLSLILLNITVLRKNEYFHLPLWATLPAMVLLVVSHPQVCGGKVKKTVYNITQIQNNSSSLIPEGILQTPQLFT